MGLDLLPRRTNRLNTKDELTHAITHEGDAPCPFAHDDFPIGPMGTCCSLRGKVAADNLHALGEMDICRRMHDSMNVAQTLQFATTLRATADRLEERYRDRKDKPRGAYEGGRIDFATGELTPWPAPSFEEAIASIRQAADWYEKVGRLSFGVFAWY